MDNVEMAQDGLEHAGEHAHGGEHKPDRSTRRAAVLVAVLAAAAVVGEMSGNDAQTNYLAAHIEASDLWNQYQAKSVRHTVLDQSAALLAALPGPVASATVGAARQQAGRMLSEPGGDGMEQLADRAHKAEARREHALHRHEQLERGVRGLQIAIVLTSLFVVTRVRWLLLGGASLGLAAGLYALAAGLSLI